MKAKVLMGLLAAAAVLLTAAHLRMPRSTQYWRMDASAAAARRGETLAVSMPSGTVDVNRAAAGELDELTGVGPSLAQEIISERERNGAFHYPEDLINVHGIGEKTLEQMRKQLKLP